MLVRQARKPPHLTTRLPLNRRSLRGSTTCAVIRPATLVGSKEPDWFIGNRTSNRRFAALQWGRRDRPVWPSCGKWPYPFERRLSGVLLTLASLVPAATEWLHLAGAV